MQNRSSFGSKFGAIAATAGSAIGLGNIWRFPYITGENGGAAFIIIYLICTILIGIPLLLTEFSIGRYTKRNVFGAFRVLKPHSHWYFIGILGIATAFVILSFYCVVAGWTMSFLAESVVNNFAGKSSLEIQDSFGKFVDSGWQPIIWTIIFIAMTAYIIISGVEKGIERYNKILMPVLFLILLILVGNSVFLPGFKDGINFLFKPDFSKIDGSVILEALGQAFFSMSLGMGTMITYGSYIRNNDNMLSTAGSVALTDILIALLAGVAIFPAVFSFGISPTSGPELVFITLPNIFLQMPGGYFLSLLFFLLLLIAAVTSAVSIMEVLAAYCTEELKISRRKSGILIAVIIMAMSSLCCISQMPDSAIRIAGMNLFDLFDTLSANYMMIIGAFLTTVFAGWFMSKAKLRNEFTSGGLYGVKLFPVFIFIVKFVAPVMIAVIFLSKIGLLRF
ncbi:MAG: sodium-dependent transporter [Rikenellaceae bacterium]|nr:sodium-dependent transporter [Rikenellaceae bacterium]